MKETPSASEPFHPSVTTDSSRDREAFESAVPEAGDMAPWGKALLSLTIGVRPKGFTWPERANSRLLSDLHMCIVVTHGKVDGINSTNLSPSHVTQHRSPHVHTMLTHTQ